MDPLHPFRDPGVRVLVVEPDRDREQEEEDEDDAGQHVADQYPTRLPGHQGVPRHVGREQPGVDDRMPGEPEQRAREQRVRLRDPTRGPREEEHQELGGDRQRRQEPHHVADHGDEREQRDARVGVIALPAPQHDQHVRQREPGAHDDQDQPDVVRPVRLERRIRRVQHTRLIRDHRVDDHQVADEQQPEDRVDQPGHERPAQRTCGHERQEPVREGEGEDQHVGDAVGGQPLVVAAQLGEVRQDVDVRVRERVGETVEDAGHERGVADVDRPAEVSLLRGRKLEAVGVEHRGRAHSTITFPNIVWWPRPQYSWQMSVYSAGSSNL